MFRADVARDPRSAAAGCPPSPTGVHLPTWIAGDLTDSIHAAYLGAGWIDRHDDPARCGEGVLSIPDEELWALCGSPCRRYLFTFIREAARGQRWVEEHVGIPRVVAAGTPARARTR